MTRTSTVQQFKLDFICVTYQVPCRQVAILLNNNWSFTINYTECRVFSIISITGFKHFESQKNYLLFLRLLCTSVIFCEPWSLHRTRLSGWWSLVVSKWFLNDWASSGDQKMSFWQLIDISGISNIGQFVFGICWSTAPTLFHLQVIVYRRLLRMTAILRERVKCYTVEQNTKNHNNVSLSTI